MYEQLELSQYIQMQIKNWAVGVVFTKNLKTTGTDVKILCGIMNTITKFKEILNGEERENE